jgi:hypothetical protein
MMKALGWVALSLATLLAVGGLIARFGPPPKTIEQTCAEAFTASYQENDRLECQIRARLRQAAENDAERLRKMDNAASRAR